MSTRWAAWKLVESLYRRAKMVTTEENLAPEPESTHAVRTPAAGEGSRDQRPRSGHPRGRRRRDQRTGRQPRHHRRRPPLRPERVQDPGARPQDRRQGGRATPGGEKNGYEGASVTCPHCGRAAEFHSHRWHTSLSLVG